MRKIKILIGIIHILTVIALVGSCDMLGEQDSEDTTAPVAVTGISGSAAGSSITVTWTDSASNDIDHYVVSWNPGSSVNVEPGAGTFTITGLTSETQYTISVIAVDTSGNESSPVTIKITSVDTVVPVGVTNISASGIDGSITVTWTASVSADVDHYLVSYSPDGTTPVEVSASAGTYTAENLTNGIEYTFIVVAVDGEGNESPAITVSFTIPLNAADLYELLEGVWERTDTNRVGNYTKYVHFTTDKQFNVYTETIDGSEVYLRYSDEIIGITDTGFTVAYTSRDTTWNYSLNGSTLTYEKILEDGSLEGLWETFTKVSIDPPAGACFSFLPEDNTDIAERNTAQWNGDSNYYILFPADIDYTSIVPYVHIPPGYNVTPASQTVQDLSNPVSYTVSGNGDTQTVTLEALHPTASNMIINGDFSYGDAGWWTYDNGDTGFEYNIGDETAHLTVEQLGEDDDGSRGFGNTMYSTLENGHYYRLTFDAWGSDRSIRVGLQEGGNDLNGDGNEWSNYFYSLFELSTSVETFSYEFYMTDPTNVSPMLVFFVGNSIGDVYIDNVVLTEISVTTDPSVNLVLNGDFSLRDSYWNMWDNIGGNTVEYDSECIHVITPNPDPDTAWEQALSQEGCGYLDNGSSYLVMFDAWGDERSIECTLLENNRDLNGDGNNFSSYLWNSVAVSGTQQTFSALVTISSPTDDDPLLKFNFGGESGEVFIDNIVIKEVDVTIDPEVNLLINGDFLYGSSMWSFSDEVGGNSFYVDNEAGHFTVENAGTNPWDSHITYNWNQSWGPLYQNSLYEISFDIWGDERSAGFVLSEQDRDLNGDGGSYTNYISYNDITISSVPVTFSTELWMLSPTDDMPNFGFNASGELGDVYIDNVVIREIPIEDEAILLSLDTATSGETTRQNQVNIYSVSVSSETGYSVSFDNVINTVGVRMFSDDDTVYFENSAGDPGYPLTFTTSSTASTLYIVITSAIGWPAPECSYDILVEETS